MNERIDKASNFMFIPIKIFKINSTCQGRQDECGAQLFMKKAGRLQPISQIRSNASLILILFSTKAMTFVHSPLCLFLLSSVCFQRVLGAQWASTPLGNIPLALRSPYLNIWTNTYNADGTEGDIANTWPTLGVNTRVGSHSYLIQLIVNVKILQVVGWCGGVRVDGKAFRWLGSSTCIRDNTTKTGTGSIQMSPTQTSWKAVAGPVQLDITFLSPIEVSCVILLIYRCLCKVEAGRFNQAVLSVQLCFNRCFLDRRPRAQCPAIFRYHRR